MDLAYDDDDRCEVSATPWMGALGRTFLCNHGAAVTTKTRTVTLLLIAASAILILPFIPLVEEEWSVSRYNGDVKCRYCLLGIIACRTAHQDRIWVHEIERLCPSVEIGDGQVMALSAWASGYTYLSDGPGLFEHRTAAGNLYASAYSLIARLHQPDSWKAAKIRELRSLAQVEDVDRFTLDLIRLNRQEHSEHASATP